MEISCWWPSVIRGCSYQPQNCDFLGSTYWCTVSESVQLHFMRTILFVTSIHQTTNLVCPNFLSFSKLFIGPKLRKNLSWTNKKFVFFFNCSSWENFVEKIGENKIHGLGGLLSRTRYSILIFSNFNCKFRNPNIFFRFEFELF